MKEPVKVGEKIKEIREEQGVSLRNFQKLQE